MELTVPGDKSLSHRALLFAALADGESRLSGVLPGADPRATARILRALGVDVPELPADGSEIRVHGAGLRGFAQPAGVLDCGNSGTTARLLLGVLAGQGLVATLDGDSSLRTRPMARVTDPLSGMGARFRSLGEEGRLPLEVAGGWLRPLEYELPVASAQIKSALLLAGVTGGAWVLLTEPGRSRDHTERMLGAMGSPLICHDAGGGAWRVEMRASPERLDPLDFHVPGDFSSAAYVLALGILGGAGPRVTVRDVGVNPTRTGLLPVLEAMGASVLIENRRESGGEPVADITVVPSELRGVAVGGREMPTLLDEVPIVAVLAARARGETRITGALELRVKESDRLAALVENLRALGVAVEELEDGLVVQGGEEPLAGSVRSRMDHRVAMAFGVLDALPGNEVEVDDRAIADVSFPGFWELLQRLSTGRPG